MVNKNRRPDYGKTRSVRTKPSFQAVHKGRKSVSQAIAALRRFHDIGRKSLKSDGESYLPRGKGMELAGKVGLSRDLYEKARQFYRKYPPDEFNKLCRTIRRGGFPVGVQHIVRLLRLPDHQRLGFLNRTIAEEWGCRTLSTAIQGATGREPHAGRNITARGVADAVGRLQGECYHWKRLILAIKTKGDGRRKSIERSLPRNVQTQLGGCSRGIIKLNEQLREMLMKE